MKASVIPYFLALLLWLAPASGRAASGELSPLDDVEVETMLKAGKSSSEIEGHVKTAGYLGKVDAESLAKLRGAGASSQLLILLYRTRTLANFPSDYVGAVVPPVETSILYAEP